MVIDEIMLKENFNMFGYVENKSKKKSYLERRYGIRGKQSKQDIITGSILGNVGLYGFYYLFAQSFKGALLAYGIHRLVSIAFPPYFILPEVIGFGIAHIGREIKSDIEENAKEKTHEMCKSYEKTNIPNPAKV